MFSKLLLIFLISSNLLVGFQAPTKQSQVLGVSDSIGPIKIDSVYLDVQISSSHVIALDIESGKIIYSKGDKETRPIASLTKLISMLVILDLNPDWQVATIMPYSSTFEGNKYIKQSEEITLDDLFYTALVGSDNSAVKALIKALGFEETKFVDLMNQKAIDIGLDNTHFVDSTGLSEKNISTARDVAKLFMLALKNSKIKDALSTEKYIFSSQLGNHTVINTNLLLASQNFQITAGKTGYTDEAGWCLATQGDIQGHPVLTVILGSNTDTNRFQDTKSIYWWLDQNYHW